MIFLIFWLAVAAAFSLGWLCKHMLVRNNPPDQRYEEWRE